MKLFCHTLSQKKDKYYLYSPKFLFEIFFAFKSKSKSPKDLFKATLCRELQFKSLFRKKKCFGCSIVKSPIRTNNFFVHKNVTTFLFLKARLGFFLDGNNFDFGQIGFLLRIVSISLFVEFVTTRKLKIRLFFGQDF